jgi:mannose-6-phosphate isomerase
MRQPVRLQTSLRERVWGRTSLAPFFPDVEKPIGEAWYLGDEELPLLVKLIFTSERLSVQVHPADGEDGPRGKTEMWHILDAEPGATIALGFREPITRERLWEATRTGEVEHLLNWVPVKAGDTYFTRAHTVHAIGAGIVLCEIQQNSDITYRLWDYGRPREIHVDKAVPICDLDVHPGASQPLAIAENWSELARCEYFVTESLRLKPGQSQALPHQRCHLLIFVEGAGNIGSARFQAGEVWLMPDGGEPVVTAGVETHLIRTYVP